MTCKLIGSRVLPKKIIISLFFIFYAVLLYPQKIYEASNGYSIPAHGTFRILNIYINIIYDQTPDRDPLKNQNNCAWMPGNPNVINDNPPVYLRGFLDTALNSGFSNAVMTRLFYESSLGNLILIGDFCVVNVRQSEVTPTAPGKNFETLDLIRTAIKKINKNGGLKTIYGHDKIEDYDFIGRGKPGVEKPFEPDGNIDFIMFNFRNSCTGSKDGEKYFYGELNEGQGYSYSKNSCSNCKIFFDSIGYENQHTMIQNVGSGDISVLSKNIAFHEFAHLLFGGNFAHLGGGNHFGTSNASVFIGLQGGYGLLGGAGSSLLSCNAYERWVLNWIDTLQNPDKYEIAANKKKSDISKKDGKLIFYLRDFVTTGDAIRIQLPYVCVGAKNQYLWLEYHKVGQNEKLDFLHYSNNNSCRETGAPGIYAYIQIGKDVNQSSNSRNVYPVNETDHLRFLSARGNWDMLLDSYADSVKCVAWNVVEPSESMWLQNPLCGYNNLQTHIWDTTGKAQKLTAQSLCKFPSIVRRYGITISNLPYLGDNKTAFSGKSKMDIGSNPAPCNIITHYTSQYYRNFSPYKANVNTRKIYLSGLAIYMEELNNGTCKVEVVWDQYHLQNDVRWTGDIVLKEELYIDEGNTLLLDQNFTPIQLFRDSISGVFSPTTVLSCEYNSKFEVAPGSKLLIDNNSKLVIKKGATFKLGNKSHISIKNNAGLIIEQGAVFINDGAKIKCKRGGYFKQY